MKATLLLFVSFFFVFPMFGQTCVWGKAVSSNGAEYGRDIAADASGNIYSVGTYSNTVDFDPGPGVHTVTGSGCNKIYVLKLNSNGDFVWVKTFGASCVTIPDVNKKLYSIVVDPSGNIVVAGSYAGTTDFDPGPGTFELTPNGGMDVFIMKMSPGGNLIWAKSIGGDTNEDYCYNLKIDQEGKIIYSGELNGSVIDLDPGPGVYSPAGPILGMFISKLDSDGNMLWAHRSIFHSLPHSMAVDPSGNVLISGLFNFTLDFDPGPGTFNMTSTSSGGDVYIFKLSSSGEFIFAKQYNSDLSPVTFGGVRVSSDPAGNIILYGLFQGTFNVNPAAGGLYVVSTFQNVNDIFLLKLSSEGEYLFVKKFGTGAGNSQFTTTSIISNQYGDIIMTGTFRSSADFNPGPGEAYLYNFNNNIAVFVVSLNSMGFFNWNKLLYNSAGNNMPSSIVTDASHNTYLTGFADIPTSSCGTNAAGGLADIFILKMGMTNTITGTCFYDQNGDGVQQSADYALRNIMVKATNTSGTEFYGITDSSGRYSVMAGTGNHTVTIPPISTYFSVNPTSNSANFTASFGSFDSLNNFGFQPAGAINDLEVVITNTLAARPGFITSYRVTYKNAGTTIQSGTLTLQHAPELVFFNTIPPSSSYSAPVLLWNYNDLRPGESRNVDIWFSVPVNVPVGSVLTSYAIVEPVTGDVTVNNNRDTLMQIVTASLDPNDKTVSPSGDISTQFVTNGEYLDYTIRFQNTGTDTAFTVMVRDTLSASLDISSFQMLSASHNYSVRAEGTDKLEWLFNNILLPDSNHNEPLSHGFIRFRIKAKSNIVLGTQIKNKVSIYFDFNSAVITNETLNTVANPAGNIVSACENSLVTLNSNITGSTYQWQHNTGSGFTDLNNGPNHSGINTAALQLLAVPLSWNNYQYRCIVDANQISEVFILNVVQPLLPSVSISTPASTVCSGTTVTFTALPMHGGTTPSYQWKKNGANTGTNSQTYTSNSLVNGDVISVEMTSSASCVTTNTVLSNSITITVTPASIPSVTISTPVVNICSGSNVTFTAIPVNGGTAPSYQWKVNGVNTGSNSATFTTNTLINNDAVSVMMISNAFCASPSTTTSNTITITVNSTTLPGVTISASSTNICSGTEVTFNAIPVNGGAAPVYQWIKNGINIGTNNTAFISSSLTNGDIISVSMTSSATCANPQTVNSNSITMTVGSPLVAAVSITASATVICSGVNVIFNASPVNGGSAPVYQWKKNGVNTGTNSQSYTTNALSNGDIISLTMTSNAPCVAQPVVNSNSQTLTVIPVVGPAVSITASATDICPGTAVTFTAFPINGGTTPFYQWKINGVNAGTNNETFSTSGLANGDIISVLLTNNNPCVNPTTATSNNIIMNVTPVLAPSVTITGPGSTNAGVPVTVASQLNNTGSNPAFKWQDSTDVHSWQNINGATASTLSYMPMSSGDKIRLLVTSNAECTNGTEISSNALAFIVNSLNTSATSVIIYPNPASTKLTIDSLLIIDQWENAEVMAINGSKHVLSSSIAGVTKASIHVEALPAGMYILKLNRRTGKAIYFKFIKL